MIESMACGTPVIAFENGSVPEVMENGVTGFIVHDERQAIDAVPQAIALDRNRIRAEFERRFPARRMAQNYLTVYSRLMKAHRPAVDAAAARQGKFLAHSLVTCSHAANPAQRDHVAVAAAPADTGLGVLQ
jgi:hypothetical protein